MEDNEKHYGQPRWRYLKNVVYRHVGTGEIIIAGLRGDLEVNKTKLEHAIDAVGQLEEATDDDLIKLGTQRGYVHSWGHPARYIGDLSLTTVRNFIGGQKEDTPIRLMSLWARFHLLDVGRYCDGPRRLYCPQRPALD